MNYFSPILPSTIGIRFPTRRCNGQASDVVPTYYVSKTNIDSLNVPIIGASSSFGFQGTKWFHDRAVALFNVSATNPSNKAALDSLASSIALDYYSWNTIFYDEVFPQIINPSACALTDTIEYAYRPGELFSRQFTFPYNFAAEELMHHDQSITGCNADGSKTPYAEMYVPKINQSAGTTCGTFSLARALVGILDGRLSFNYESKDNIACLPPTQCCYEYESCVPTQNVPISGYNWYLLSGSTITTGGFSGGELLLSGYSGTSATFCVDSSGSTIQYLLSGNTSYYPASGTVTQATTSCGTTIIPTVPTKTSGAADITTSGFSGCGDSTSDYSGIVVQAVQSGTGTQTCTTDSHGQCNFSALFNVYDPPWNTDSISVTQTDPQSRYVTKSILYGPNPHQLNPCITYTFGDVYINGECSGSTFIDNDFQGTGIYACTPCHCFYPTKQTLTLSDPVYGLCTLIYQCPSGSWTGSISVSVAACTWSVFGFCGIGGFGTYPCPAATLTINYTLDSSFGLTINYYIYEVPCTNPTFHYNCAGTGANQSLISLTFSSLSVCNCPPSFMAVIPFNYLTDNSCTNIYQGQSGNFTITE